MDRALNRGITMHIKTEVEFAHLDSSDEKTVGMGALEFAPIDKGKRVLVQLFIEGGLNASAEVSQPRLRKRKRKTHDVYSDFVAPYEVWELTWGGETMELGKLGAEAAKKMLVFMGLVSDE